jgi:hypothetical protein
VAAVTLLKTVICAVIEVQIRSALMNEASQAKIRQTECFCHMPFNKAVKPLMGAEISAKKYAYKSQAILLHTALLKLHNSEINLNNIKSSESYHK